ncbi:MAG TPA: GspH/FimT family pseudopilin [Stellaceae bacterium]|jgi:general secretion pathway protein H|nr:GspH/FimT family pseudopilin [Stellaceae bacterium]
MPRPIAQRGFTLIEMLVVLTIAALIVGLALPRLTGAEEKATLRTAAHEVAAALRNTRSLAMTRGQTEAFIINTANGAFRAGQAAPAQLPRGIQLALVTTTADQESASQGRIQFFADGSSTGGGVLLASGKTRSQVLVDWLTGRVSIAEGADAAAR